MTVTGVPVGYRVGAWEVTAPIASGSWGTVHAARRVADRAVATGGPEQEEGADRHGPGEAALKFLTTAGLAPRQARELAETAQREVEFSREAAHPHLVRVYDTLVVDDPARPETDGAVVLVMERASRSLQDVLAAQQPLPDAARILGEVCAALAHLHEAGWVHGDLKPANILLAADGSVRVADFGLVARMEGTHGYAPPWGSPDYLPPERRSAPLSERGVQTRASLDVWAFGVTAHQLLTGGSLPFPGGTPGARAAAVADYAAGRAPLRLSPDLPSAWRELIADCLTADPAEREGHTAAGLLPRIEAAAGAGPQPGRPRARVIAAGAAVAALLAAAGAGALWWHDPDDDPRASSGTAPDASVVRQVKVFNSECEKKGRIPTCSLGLAVNPKAPYEAKNVVRHRVWHGELLKADCVVLDGVRISDESGVSSPRWFRVLLPDVPGGHAYLSAVRTRDQPKVPECGSGTNTPWFDRASGRLARPDGPSYL